VAVSRAEQRMLKAVLFVSRELARRDHSSEEHPEQVLRQLGGPGRREVEGDEGGAALREQMGEGALVERLEDRCEVVQQIVAKVRHPCVPVESQTHRQ
jgi:hypothetical protein